MRHPTRSGIIGMIASAMGIDRNDPDEERRISELNALKMTVLGLQKERLGQCALVSGLQIPDYHTAQTLNKERQPVGNADLTQRDYLIDSRYLVELVGDDGLLGLVLRALKNPRWFVTLGRRCCVPSCPVLLGWHDSEAEALDVLSKRLDTPISVILRVSESEPGTPGSEFLRDLPLGFSTRRWGQRSVRIEPS